MRPPKFATAKEAAENNLYSKWGGAIRGFSLEEFIDKVTAKCEVCGSDPSEHLHVSRKADAYDLRWNYIVRDAVVVCGTCKRLALVFDIDYIVGHCAKIMAKRSWEKRRTKAELSTGLERWANSVIPDPGITPEGRSRGGS